jgi:NAD(P)-dependent dehydrogenase (short-subunit alcohol dehydrogenase family)
LGFELVKKLVEHGGTVFAGKYRTQWTLLEQLRKQWPDRLHIMDLDVSSGSSVRKATDYISNATGSIDVLINNAGVCLSSFGKNIFTELDDSDYELMLTEYNINALGALRVTNALISLIVKGYDRLIVNISSEAGSIGTCWRTAGFGYCMSKAAMNMQSAITYNAVRNQHGCELINFHPGFMQSVIGVADASPGMPHVEMAQDIKYYTTPENTAQHIFQIICGDHNRYVRDKPAFINYLGDPIEW